MTKPNPLNRDVFIPVKSRTTIGETEVIVAVSAACPVKGTDVPLEECAECPRGGELRVGRNTRDLSVRCRLDDVDGVPRAEPAPSVRKSGPAASASTTLVSEIMTTHVICVRPDLSVEALERLLLERGISGVPVVDSAGLPLGVVSSTDVLRHHAETAERTTPASATVEDIMMPLVFCLPANESIAKAAALMAFENVHRIPVLGPTHAVVGLLSPLDVLRWLAREHGYVIGPHD